jgi:DNA polymerase-3 subunit epsilon/ATP-dependent DNA helicase DinG
MAIASFVEEFVGRDGEQRVPVTAGRRAQPLWGDVEEASMHVELALVELGRRLEHVREAVGALPPGELPGLDALRARVAQADDSARQQRATLQEAVQRADPALIVWASADGPGPRLRTAPLEVAERLRDELYARCDSVVATSATLAAQGSFDFSVRRLGLLEPDTLDVGSPFDYRRAVLILTPDDIPEPGEAGYEAAAHEALIAATRAAGGRSLALFTSHGAVHAASAALRGRLAGEGIGVLAQDIDGGPARLLRALAEQPRSLVLGTAAFWEGVDVRGDTLSMLAIARLPFPVPSDPIHAARAGQYDDPFAEFSLPSAVLRFRQGFGRLIRGPEERGVFLVLDRRLLSREYGPSFLDALPDCDQRTVSTREIARAVAEWLEPLPTHRTNRG